MNGHGGSPAPGWYPDATRPAQLRWWDGKAWTDHVSPVPPGHSDADVEYIGGMNVPSVLGRLNATYGLAALRISGRSVRISPRLFGRALFTDFEVPLGEISVAFPLRGGFLTSGIGLELADGQLAYFWTWRGKEEILSRLERLGVLVDPRPRRAKGALLGQFQFVGKVSTAATMPTLSRPMMYLTPVALIAGVVVIVLFARTDTPFGWVAAAWGTLGLIRTVFILRRMRR